jgi:hypothetical protein
MMNIIRAASKYFFLFFLLACFSRSMASLTSSSNEGVSSSGTRNSGSSI